MYIHYDTKYRINQNVYKTRCISFKYFLKINDVNINFFPLPVAFCDIFFGANAISHTLLGNSCVAVSRDDAG